MPADPPASSTTASRLCAACGLCCNGVLFEIVRLQPADSPKALSGLGIKLKSRHAQPYFKQPCSAYGGGGCTIYAQRPQRCRLFDCSQLLRVATGEISESAALETIRETLELVAHIESLLRQAGDTNFKKPLLKRCRTVLADLDLAGGAAPSWLGELAERTQALDQRLTACFRLPSAG